MLRAGPADILREGLRRLEVPDPERAQALLERYLDELERWNPRFRFVKVADTEELVVKHALDSLSAWRIVRDGAEFAAGAGAHAGSVIDVGSGAGFPGFPLAAALPELSFTLLERSSRKASFLRTCAILLGLPRVEVRHAELSAVSGEFDVLTFRAVAPLDRIIAEIERAALRFRVIVAYKGRESRAREEIASLRRTAIRRFAVELRPVQVPFLDEERCIAILRPTPFQLLTNG